MAKIADIIACLEQIAPLATAESWDNVGLLLGGKEWAVERIMTCLTITFSVMEEAIQENVGLIVTHHPIPFKPLQRVTTDSTTGRILLRAAEKRIAIYSPHTAWDNAERGINRQLADLCQLEDVSPLKPFLRPLQANTGVGRCGMCSVPTTVRELSNRLAQVIPYTSLRVTHDPDMVIHKLGIICGSGGSMLTLVAENGCDGMLTGEATYHQCLEAESLGICLIQIGHHASEAFAMKTLANMIHKEFSNLRVFASTQDRSVF